MTRISIAVLILTLSACACLPFYDPGPPNIQVIEDTSVLVRAATPSGMKGHGTGVVIKLGKDYSIILTAAHIYVPGAKYSIQTARGVEVEGCYFIDHSTEIDAGVMFVPKRLRAAIEFAERMPERGETIYVSGNKLGTGFWPTHGLYGGMVNPSRARSSAPTIPGNSGGAVVYDCKLIGIVSSILQGRQLYPTAGIFVPITAIRPYLDSIKDKLAKDKPERLTGFKTTWVTK